MNLTRRTTLIGLGALGLAACGAGNGTLGPASGTGGGLPADLRPVLARTIEVLRGGPLPRVWQI